MPITENAEDEREYTVTGMTCSHCAAAVTEEVSALGGIEAVEVDLASGRMSLRGDAPDEAIRGAVEEAGYTAERRS
jgi:copper chaperone CopZ